MVTSCRVDDCQFTADGRCDNPGSYSQCLQDSACTTPAEFEEAAAVLEPLQASQILHDPCAAFPEADTCHRLIDWCCNGATVIVDGQAVYLTLFQEVTAVVEVPVSCEPAAFANYANDNGAVQSNISVRAPSRDLDCSVGLNVSRVHCGTPSAAESTSSTLGITTTPGTAGPTTHTRTSLGEILGNESKAWVEVKVDLPFRNTSGVVPEIPGNVLETLDSKLVTIFGEAGMGAENVPQPDLSGATVEVVFDVRSYIDYAEVRAAVDAAASFYGDSFVHPVSTFAPSTTSSQLPATVTSFPVWMLGQAQELGGDYTWTIVGSVVAVVALVGIAVATILILKHQAKHRIVRTNSFNRESNSFKVKHAHDGELNHKMTNTAAPKRDARGPRTKAVASAVVLKAEASQERQKSQQPKKGGRRVFHRRHTSLSDVSPEFASPDYVKPVTDSENAAAATTQAPSSTANRIELADIDEDDVPLS